MMNTMHAQWQDFLSQYIPAFNITAEDCLVDLSHLGLLKVAGPDAKKLLQGQLTCNMEEMTPSHLQLAAHCNPQGRIISLFYIFYFQEAYYLYMPLSMISLALNALKKYAVFFKAQLSDASDQMISIGYKGNAAIENAENTRSFKVNDRYFVFGQCSAIAALWSKLAETAIYTTIESWQHLDFIANIPSIYPETSEKFLPHELGLPHLQAISFNKGCYTGQEIIARMEYRGRAKNHLYYSTVISSITPSHGGSIYDAANNIVGMVVDYYKKDYTTYALQIVTSKTDDLFLGPDKQYPIGR
jgi:hypothetical protein